MLEFGDGRGFALFQQLAAQCGGELTHGDDFAILGSEEGGVERHIADIAAGEGGTVQPGTGNRCPARAVSWRGKMLPPQFWPVLLVGQRKLDDEMQTAGERLVDVAAADLSPG